MTYIPKVEYSRVQRFNRGLLAIRRMWMNTCDAPLVVYLELITPAAVNAGITFLSFGMLDLIRGYFRPKGLRSGRHMGRGRKGRRRGGGIPDTAELIAKRIPGQSRFANRKVSDGVRTLWEIDNKGQAIFFWVMVYNLIKDFVYESASPILEFAATECGTRRAAYARGTGDWVPAGVVATISVPEKVYERNITIGSQSSVSVPTGLFDVVAANKVLANPNDSSALEGRIGTRVIKGGVETERWQGWQTAQPGETLSQVASATVIGPANVQVLVEFRNAAGFGEFSMFTVRGF